MNLEELSVGDIEQFKDHPVWRVMLNDLKEMREMIRDSLEDAPLEDTIVESEKGMEVVKGVRKLQGASSILKHLIELPDMMLMDLKDIKSVEEVKEDAKS